MFRERKFRFNLWVLMPGFTVGVFVVVQLLLLTGRWHTSLGKDPLVTIGAFAACALFCGILWAIFPAYAGKDGLRGTDGIGRFHDVPWDAMGKVSSLLGFYWILHGKLGKALLFPKFLEDKRSFRDYVLQHAPEGNSLRKYLQNG